MSVEALTPPPANLYAAAPLEVILNPIVGDTTASHDPLLLKIMLLFAEADPLR